MEQLLQLAKLHISGNSDVSDEDCQLIIDDVDGSAGSRVPSIQFRSVTGGTTTNQGRIRATDTQGMILSGSSAQGDDLVVQAGKVGIGTAAPSFHSFAGDTNQIGLEINNPNNDSSAQLKLTGRNNTGTPGQATSFEIGHRGDSLRTTMRHGGNDTIDINSSGHVHINPYNSSSTQLFIGGQGGYFGGNSSHNMRAAGAQFMFNAGGSSGSYIFEANGQARLTIANDGVSLASAAPSADSYTHKFRSSNSADPGILLYREGQCALGITVRNASVDYASFLVGSSGASTSYDTEAGTTNVPLRIYQNGNVVLCRGAHAYNSNDGHIFYSSGRWASTFNYNSAGAEIYIQDNRTSSGTVAAMQYRINNSAQSGGTIYAGTNGYTGGNFSDYRLKNNVENLTGSLDKINALRVVSYNHVDSPDLTELGVIAHEIQEVFPEFVRGEKDAVWTQTDIDNYEGTIPDVQAGDIRAQQVDYFSKEWTSHFIKAFQEQQAIIDDLKSRLDEAGL